ncbi:hypothetical protein [Salmonella sp. s54412]|uniref:hypothetical protein n=1 Tax=unclassified Salmonella TaxID=2614656 RepID=UPI0037548DE8
MDYLDWLVYLEKMVTMVKTEIVVKMGRVVGKEVQEFGVKLAHRDCLEQLEIRVTKDQVEVRVRKVNRVQQEKQVNLVLVDQMECKVKWDSLERLVLMVKLEIKDLLDLLEK